MSENKLIARNTLMLYIRMLFSMLVAFYTSRAVLNILGVTDFGINNVVCGVAALLSFLNGSLAGATSRFLAYDLSLGDLSKLKSTFSATVTVHLALAVILFIIYETVGLWFVENQLVIPNERLLAGNIVYQFSILSMMLAIMQVPYSATLIAHEKMDVFAYLGIADTVLKLIAVIMLQFTNGDKLIYYGSFYFIAVLLITSAYFFYCKRNFVECSFKLNTQKAVLKPILTFSVCDLYGNMSITLKNQGINILQNLFWGPAINAATGIANQVLNAVLGFSWNFTTAIKPRIIKLYAQNEIKEMQKLVIEGSKYSLYLIFLFSFPILLRISDVLDIWLIDAPAYACQFCALVIVYNWIDTLTIPLTITIHATGRMKHISLVTGSIYLLSLPITYVFLKLGYSPLTPFIINIGIVALAYISNLTIVKQYIKSYDIKQHLHKGLCLPVLVVAVGAIFPLLLNHLCSKGWMSFFGVCLVSFLSELFVIYTIGLNKKEKGLVVSFLQSKLRR